MVFQRQLFYLPADSRQALRDFCPSPAGSESEKKSGVGPQEFNGEVEILAPNFSPPNYWRAAVRVGLDTGARALPNIISPATWASKFGRKKIFFEKIFFGRKLQGKSGGKFLGITGGRSYTVPIAFGRGGIETLRLSFATGSPGNWGSHGPPKLGQILDTFLMPPKIEGVVGKSFPLEGILSREVRRGWPPPSTPISPQKNLEGVEIPKFDPLFLKNCAIDFRNSLLYARGHAARLLYFISVKNSKYEL